MTKVCVVGLGYIGLPTAAMLAARGCDVVGYDISESAVASINSGVPHFHEPDLQMLLSAAVQTGKFRAQTSPEPADCFIIAVPTPFGEGKRPDLTHVTDACDAIGPMLHAGTTVILESTSPVGTTEGIAKRLAAARPDLRFPRYKEDTEPQVAVAHCPERILPGQMLRELVSNDRIIGGMTEFCSRRAFALYDTFVAGETFLTDARTAEFVKLIENAFRDVNIAFANELSMICDRLEVDVWKAIELANRHPRVSILRPGAGVGGHCIAVDPWFLVHDAPNESQLIRTAREVNDAKPLHVIAKVRTFAERFKAPVVACYGLTYKPDVADLRESPALEIVRSLAALDGVRVLVCDPLVDKLPRELPSSAATLVESDRAAKEADIVVFLVGHRSFKQLRPTDFLNKVVVDTIGLMSSGGSLG